MEAERLRKLRDTARELKFGYWIDQVDIQARGVDGLALIATGRERRGLQRFARAAREDATEKHVVTPGLLVPARELLATALLKEAKAAEALRTFEAVLTEGAEPLPGVRGGHAGGRARRRREEGRLLAERAGPDHRRRHRAAGDRAGPEGTRPIVRR